MFSLILKLMVNLKAKLHSNCLQMLYQRLQRISGHYVPVRKVLVTKVVSFIELSQTSCVKVVTSREAMELAENQSMDLNLLTKTSS
mmetsp:Transcript_94061/g.265646  ORF Transcript_94061/g.265646 Transcript_94061/m.265646 type:complete len:86 (+) Transcript_94061:125-382(+)